MYFCHNNELLQLCGGEPYDPAVQFCDKNTIQNLCGGQKFDLSAYTCLDDILMKKCGNDFYDSTVYYCKNNRIYFDYTDGRDGQVYPIVKIGTQFWMDRNLNYEVSYVQNGIINADAYLGRYYSYCEFQDLDSCMRYGQGYSWALAMNLGSAEKDTTLLGSVAKPIQGICPDGFHLPSKQEFNTLVNYAGGTYAAGKYLKSTEGWANNGGGIDSLGFNAVPEPQTISYTIDFETGDTTAVSKFYDVALFWTSDEVESFQSSTLHLEAENSRITFQSSNKTNHWKVRCLVD